MTSPRPASRVGGGRADEPEAAPLQLLGQRRGFRRAARAGRRRLAAARRAASRARSDQTSSVERPLQVAAALALAIAASILPRWRTMPASPSSRSTSRLAEAATSGCRSPRRPPGSSPACAGSSSTRDPTGRPRAPAARRSAVVCAPDGPTPRRGRRRSRGDRRPPAAPAAVVPANERGHAGARLYPRARVQTEQTLRARGPGLCGARSCARTPAARQDWRSA